MRRSLLAAVAAIALAGGVSAVAQDHSNPMDHQQHMAAMASDGRELVNFPPAMRAHTLANMRDHLQALSEILTAMSSAQYASAARIADTRLGLASPSAEGCKAEGTAATPQMSQPASMDHQMAQFMPENMRKIGLAMHQSASAFAVAAAKAGRTGNAKPALAALSRVTAQCAACHAAYRVQ
jgi:hypothetical protein